LKQLFANKYISQLEGKKTGVHKKIVRFSPAEKLLKVIADQLEINETLVKI
jgi:hypothetical protein